MSIDSVVNLNISRSAAAVSRAGFGTALILGPNAAGWDTDRIREYTAAADMLDDGFETTDAEYKAALKLMGQAVRPVSFKVGRRLSTVAQVKTFTPVTSTQAIQHYIVTLNGVVFDFTSDSDPTAAEVVTGLIALINAGTEPVTASGTTTLILTADTAGIGFSATGSANLTGVATTANVGVSTDLAEISAIDDDWYALVLTSRTVVEMVEAASYIEAVRKVYIACNGDSAVIAAGSTDVASLLMAASYARTLFLYSADYANMPEAALLGNLLPLTPGAWTAKFKTLAGITVDTLSATQRSVALAKNAMVYTTVGGLGMTEEGKVASGEFLDVIFGVDWIHVATILAEDPAPAVTIPLVADQDPADVATRTLGGITFTGTLAGAVHALTISGNDSV